MASNLEMIRELLHRKLFRPFRVVMRSDARHDIIDREKVAIGRSKAFVFLPRMTELAESDIELVYEPRRAR